VTAVASKEQSIPPWPVLQMHDAVHVVLNAEQDKTEFPDGSLK
jgi:hypothetical protein